MENEGSGSGEANDDVRVRLVRLVLQRPGIAITEAAKELDVTWSTVAHHLDHVQDRVVSHVLPGRHLLYPRSQASNAPLHAMLRSPPTRRVAADVLENPGTSLLEVMRRLNLSARVAYYHLKRLADAGLIIREPPSNYTRLLPADHLAALLEETQKATGEQPAEIRS